MFKVLLAPALLAALTASPLFAQQPSQPAVHVSYADLDLTAPAGVAKLDHRLRGAVDRLCPAEGVTTLQAKVERMRCRDEIAAKVADQRRQAVAAASQPTPYAAR